MTRAVLLLLLAIVPAAAQEPDASVETAGARFEEAVTLRREDPAAAREAFRDAARQFEALVEVHKAHNADVHFNAGNAWYLADDMGRAILHYRQALEYAPGDTAVRSNLQEARMRRRDVIRQPAPDHMFSTLLFWHYDFAARTRAGLFLFAYVLCWPLAVAYLYKKRAEFRWALAVCAIAALLLAGSLLLEAIRDARRAEGVVLASEVTVRAGPGPTHETALPVPLHAGAEFEVTQTDGDWCAIALADGRSGWVPQSAVALLE